MKHRRVGKYIGILLVFLFILNTNAGSVNGSIALKTGGEERIPIPLYHCIDDRIWGTRSMFVSPAAFDAQMKYLKQQGYTAITFQDLQKKNRPKKPIMITFDDGYEDNYLQAYPILKKYGLKATIFLIGKAIGKEHYLNRSQILQMRDIIDFQSHSMSHPHLKELSRAQIEYELAASRISLEMLMQKKVEAIAYPYGDYDCRVIEIAQKYYRWGLTTRFGKYGEKNGNRYLIKRMMIFSNTDMKKFMGFF